MSYYFKTIYPLVVIAIAVGLAMGLTYQLLEPKLIAAAKAEEQLALKKVLPEAVSFAAATTNNISFYYALDATNGTNGLIVKTSSFGYGGQVEALVAITNNALAGITITAMAKETPGLGTKAAEPKWLGQFKDITGNRIPKNKAGFKENGLDAISGATLTSMAVVSDLRKAFEVYHTIYGLPAYMTNQTNTWDAESGASKRAEE